MGGWTYQIQKLIKSARPKQKSKKHIYVKHKTSIGSNNNVCLYSHTKKRKGFHSPKECICKHKSRPNLQRTRRTLSSILESKLIADTIKTFKGFMHLTDQIGRT
jgi:hypothetical protein